MDSRYDDLVVRFPDGGWGILAAAAVLEALSGKFAAQATTDRFADRLGGPRPAAGAARSGLWPYDNESATFLTRAQQLGEHWIPVTLIELTGGSRVLHLGGRATPLREGGQQHRQPEA